MFSTFLLGYYERAMLCILFLQVLCTYFQLEKLIALSLLYFFDVMFKKKHILLPDEPSSYEGKVLKYANFDRYDFFRNIDFKINCLLSTVLDFPWFQRFQLLGGFVIAYKTQRLMIDE